jgi:hypothetical protein
MWKLIVGFIVFAALGIWLLMRGGEIDMSGEKHDTGSHSQPAPDKSAAPKQ